MLILLILQSYILEFIWPAAGTFAFTWCIWTFAVYLLDFTNCSPSLEWLEQFLFRICFTAAYWKLIRESYLTYDLKILPKMKNFRLCISHPSNITMQTYLHAYRKMGGPVCKWNIYNFLNTFFMVIFLNIKKVWCILLPHNPTETRALVKMYCS